MVFMIQDKYFQDIAVFIQMYLYLSDWSLNQWYLDNSFTPGSNLDSSTASSLMEATELGEYLLSPMISRDDPFGRYAAAYLGWSSGKCF